MPTPGNKGERITPIKCNTKIVMIIRLLAAEIIDRKKYHGRAVLLSPYNDDRKAMSIAANGG